MLEVERTFQQKQLLTIIFPQHLLYQISRATHQGLDLFIQIIHRYKGMYIFIGVFVPVINLTAIQVSSHIRL